MDVRWYVAGLVLVASLAGCTGSTNAPTAGNSPVEPAPRAGLSGPAQATSWTPPAGTKPKAQPVQYALVAANGRRVTVAAFGGGCTVTAHLSATETASDVVLHLFGYQLTGHHIVCTANLLLWTRSVTLVTPLAGWHLIDGSIQKAIPSFDGRRLAGVGWLPQGSEPPANRPIGRGWARIYSFPNRRAAPIEIDQVYGNHLGESVQPRQFEHVTALTVHGHRARLVAERGAHGRLVEDRLAWVEHGYTMTVESVPEYRWQRPSSPAVVAHIARELRLPTARL